MLVACMEGTEEKTLEEWLDLAREGRRDRGLHEVVLGHRHAPRSWLDGRKGWAD